MIHQWKPGDKAVPDDPQSPRNSLFVWLVAKMDSSAWSVADRPGGPVVDSFEESRLSRPMALQSGGVP